MSFTTACTKCGAPLQAADTAKGKPVRCKTCGGVFVARPVAGGADDRPSSPSATVNPRRRAAAETDDDDRPRRPSKASRREEEEEDRPRRRSRDKGDEPRSKAKKKDKQKDKKKAAGPPVRLLALIGAGALVLIGGGIGAAVFFSDGGPPDQPVVKAGAFEAPVHAVRGKSEGAAGAWVEHADAEGKYRIRFPQQPSAQPLTINEGGLQLTGKTMTVQNGQEVFAISALALADPNASPEMILNAAEQQAAGQITGAATVLDKKPVTHAGVAGRELTVSGSGGLGGAVRLFVKNGRLYILRAVGPGYQPTTSNVVNFFESLRFD